MQEEALMSLMPREASLTPELLIKDMRIRWRERLARPFKSSSGMNLTS